MRFTVQQIIDFKMGWDVTGITKDGSDLIDPIFFEQIQLLELPYINWSLPELKDLIERTFFMIWRTESWLKNKIKEATATKSTGKGSAKKNTNSQEGTSALAIPSSFPTSSGSSHSTQGGDDGEDPDKRVDLVLACELNIVISKRRSKSKKNALKPIQQMIDEAPEMNTLPSFVDEMIQSITSSACSLSPKSAEATQGVPVVEDVHDLDLPSTVLQVPLVISPSSSISTFWLQ